MEQHTQPSEEETQLWAFNMEGPSHHRLALQILTPNNEQQWRTPLYSYQEFIIKTIVLHYFCRRRLLLFFCCDVVVCIYLF